MAKKIAILQSNYLPWKGYFDIIGLVDEFVIYDEVQYTKNDWRNRNKIKTDSGVKWLTVPVYQKSLSQKISETEISDKRWAAKHWNSLKTYYSKAPCFKECKDVFEEFYNLCPYTLLSQINTSLIRIICEFLEIKTIITQSTSYPTVGNPTEKLIAVCKQASAEVYLSGPAGRNYIDVNLFEQEGITIEWMDYSHYPEYPQLHPPFEHSVSIIDLIFNTGHHSAQFMKFKNRWT